MNNTSLSKHGLMFVFAAIITLVFATSCGGNSVLTPSSTAVSGCENLEVVDGQQCTVNEQGTMQVKLKVSSAPEASALEGKLLNLTVSLVDDQGTEVLGGFTAASTEAVMQLLKDGSGEAPVDFTCSNYTAEAAKAATKFTVTAEFVPDPSYVVPAVATDSTAVADSTKPAEAATETTK